MVAPAAPRHAGDTPVERLEHWFGELRDRLVASDPGRARLRAGLGALVCVGTALPVQLGVGALLGYPGQVGFAATMFGAVVAMLGSNALVGSDRRVMARTALFFPVAVSLGLLAATVTGGQRLLQAVGFGLVLFLAVWVRRFGTAWFFYGFMGWMGFFFATFLQATLALVPELVVASVVSTAWVLLLSTTVLRTDPRQALTSSLDAFFASGRSVARECADLLAVDGPNHSRGRRERRAMRSVQRTRSSVVNASLMAEAWSGDRGAVPDGWSASALRRRLIESQQAVEWFSGSAMTLHAQADADPGLVAEGRRLLDTVAGRRDRAALAAAGRLERAARAVRAAGGDGWWPALHLAHGVREFLRFDAASDQPPEVDPGEEEFEAATSLVFGGLPGAPAAARDVAARGGRWNPLARASMSSRQAVQVAIAGLLAIAAGSLLSPTRYYWAVITAFVVFAGTATRSETFLKGAARMAGTLLGLVAAIVLAHVTAGHDVAVFAVILGSIFAAFYLQKLSQTAMTFFITVVLGQLYTVLGTFSDGLLVLRLEETVVGAVAGIVVALVFAPLSTRDTAQAARDGLLRAVAENLEAAASYAEGQRLDLDARTRALDDRARQLTLVLQPLVRPLVPRHSSASTRRRLQLYIALVSQCRALSLSLQRCHDCADGVAPAARALSRAALALTTTGIGQATEAADRDLDEGDLALLDEPWEETSGAVEEDSPARHLHHLSATLDQIAETRRKDALTAAGGTTAPSEPRSPGR